MLFEKYKTKQFENLIFISKNRLPKCFELICDCFLYRLLIIVYLIHSPIYMSRKIRTRFYIMVTKGAINIEFIIKLVSTFLQFIVLCISIFSKLTQGKFLFYVKSFMSSNITKRNFDKIEC